MRSLIALVAALTVFATPLHGPNDPALDGTDLVRTAPLVATLPDGTLLPFVMRLPAAPSARRPVVLVIHGYATTGLDYSWIADHLASRGFAAALVETQDPFETNFETWAVQTVATLDALARADANPWSGIFGELDLSRVAALGHSYGGTTAIATAARDSRISVVVALEPGAAGGFHAPALADAAKVKVPLLVVGGSLDPICPPATQAVPIFAAATSASSRLYVEIARGDHLGFLDFYFAPPPYRDFLSEHAIASRYFTAWLETKLLGHGDPDGYTDGRAAALDVKGGDLTRFRR